MPIIIFNSEEEMEECLQLIINSKYFTVRHLLIHCVKYSC